MEYSNNLIPLVKKFTIIGSSDLLEMTLRDRLPIFLEIKIPKATMRMAISMPGICFMKIIQFSSNEDNSFSEMFCMYGIIGAVYVNSIAGSLLMI